MLSNREDDAKTRKNDDLRDLIKYYFDLNNALEDRCTRINNFSLQFLLLCILGAGFILYHWHGFTPVLFTLAFSFLCVHMLFLLLIVIAYESELRAKDSLFSIEAENGEAKEWFYFRGESVIKHFSRAILRPRGSPDAPRPYVEGLRSFVRNYREEDINQKIINNMEQLYLLQAQHSHCNRLYFRLRRLRFWAMATSMTVLLTLAPLFYFFTNW